MAKTNGKDVSDKYVFREEMKNNNEDGDDEDKPSEGILDGLKKPRMRGIIINLCYQVGEKSIICISSTCQTASHKRRLFAR